MTELVTVDDVYKAAERLSGVSVRTPLVSWLGTATDHFTSIKPESLQATGAFKLRGAYNMLASLSGEQRNRGVVTYSSGNHGQAVAWAARHFSAPACVVVPKDGSPVKIEAIKAYGAEVITVPNSERATEAGRIAAERQATIVPPYEHAAVIAGQGTVGLEIAEDAADVSAVLVPVGGGGLISGIGLAVGRICPHAKIIGVEPELAADAAQSHATGQRVAWSEDSTWRTSADGLRTAQLGDQTWNHIRAYVHDFITVSEHEIHAAIAELIMRVGIVAEPSGAVAPAAALHHHAELPPGHTVAVVSGRNVEPNTLTRDLGIFNQLYASRDTAGK